METPFTGRCACGGIRYSCAAPPAIMLNCHCRSCQRSSGGACASAVLVPAAALSIEGEPRWYVSKADSGSSVRRGFCSDCGSPLFSGNVEGSEFVAVKVGSLDDPSQFKPMIDIWTECAQPWEIMDPALPKFAKQPQMG